MTNISCSIKKLFNINIRCRNWKNIFCHLSNCKIFFVDFLSQFKKILIVFNRKNRILKIIFNFEIKSCFRFWLFNIFKTESFWFMISIDCMWLCLQISCKTMKIISLIIITEIFLYNFYNNSFNLNSRKFYK